MTLSVVVPCYRSEAYLGDCLDSILVYGDDDLEVVAVDDGSPDACPAILDKYAGRDPRLRVVHLAANSGPGPARNAGLQRATGDYVWFVDSDDWLPPGAMRAVLDRLPVTRPDVLIVDHAEMFGDVPVRRAAVGLLDGQPTPLRLAQQPKLLRLAQSACTKIVRRGLLYEIDLRFPTGWYEDVLFSHALLIAAGRIEVLNEICYCYRQQTPGSITTTRSARHFEVFDQYDRLFTRVKQTFRPELFRIMVDHYLVILGSRSRLPHAARQAFFRRIVEDYRRWRPASGYPVPGGVQGIKHRLVRHAAYRIYAALRRLYRRR